MIEAPALLSWPSAISIVLSLLCVAAYLIGFLHGVKHGHSRERAMMLKQMAKAVSLLSKTEELLK